MESKEKQEIIDKVQKLLALTNSSFEGEARAAKQKAAELMARYSISMMDLSSEEKVKKAFVRVEVKMVNGRAIWEGSLCVGTSKAFDCAVVRIDHGTHFAICFLGTESDVELATYFYKYLRRTVGQMSVAFSSKKIEQDDYGRGIVQTVSERLEELYRMRNEVNSDCRDLVIVKQKGLEVFVKEHFPRLINGKNRAVGRSFVNGKEDGKKVNLCRPVRGNEQSKQIGG